MYTKSKLFYFTKTGELGINKKAMVTARRGKSSPKASSRVWIEGKGLVDVPKIAFSLSDD